MQLFMLQRHSTLSMVLSLLGAFASPLGLAMIAFGQKRSAINAFILGFLAEVVESAFSARGEMLTFGRVLDLKGLIYGTAIAGLLTGSLAAWHHSKPFRKLLVGGVIALVIIGGIHLTGIGR